MVPRKSRFAGVGVRVARRLAVAVEHGRGGGVGLVGATRACAADAVHVGVDVVADGLRLGRSADAAGAVVNPAVRTGVLELMAVNMLTMVGAMPGGCVFEPRVAFVGESGAGLSAGVVPSACT